MTLTAQCLCGAIRATIGETLRQPTACHCGQCRRWSGHVWASVSVPQDRIAVEGEENLRWFRSSDRARRGFCGICGTSMFWQADGDDSIDVAAGAIANPTGLRLESHIYVADKGDYYDIADGLPQYPQSSAT